MVKRSGSVRSSVRSGGSGKREWSQGGKLKWQRSERSSARSNGRRAFQDWRVKGEMNRSTSSSEIGTQSGKAFGAEQRSERWQTSIPGLARQRRDEQADEQFRIFVLY